MVGCGELRRLAGEEARLVLPQRGLGRQCCLPALFQGVAVEPVLRLDGILMGCLHF